MLQFVPRLLNQVLPALSSDIDQVRLAASRVNNSLMTYIKSLSEESSRKPVEDVPTPSARPRSMPPPASNVNPANIPNVYDPDRRDSTPSQTSLIRASDRASLPSRSRGASPVRFERTTTRPATPCAQDLILDYEAAVGALTLQFLNENEATRVAALSWLLMLQKRAPRKVCTSYGAIQQS
jgi:vacuole morphology and inheritance protein 14